MTSYALSKEPSREAEATTSSHKLAFLVRDLGYGGAQRQLLTLATGLARRGWEVVVLAFYAGGAYDSELREVGVRLIDLKKAGRWDVPGFLVRLFRILVSQKPCILHGYLPMPNIVALMVGRLLSTTRVVWGIRSSHTDLNHYDWLRRVEHWLEKRLAAWPDLSIFNSAHGANLKMGQDFPSASSVVIPNGIDTDKFRFDVDARGRIRREWGIDQGATLVGLVGRLDPVKDHGTFLRAAALAAADGGTWKFVCVGDGRPEYEKALQRLSDSLGLGRDVIWAPGRVDMPAVYSALDLVCSTSLAEGFPNVIGEAMACGRPCVATDAGDSARIIGDTGIVVGCADPAAIAGALHKLKGRLEAGVDELARSTRQRILREFSVDRLVERTDIALRRLIQN